MCDALISAGKVITATGHVDDNSNVACDKCGASVAGLYDVSTNTLITSWENLIDAGIIVNTNGVLSTPYDDVDNNSTSNAVLNGNLLLPNDGSVKSLGDNAFSGCTGLTSVTFMDTSTWYCNSTQVDVTDEAKAAEYLTSTYLSYAWHKS